MILNQTRPIDELLSRLEDVRDSGAGWSACCPAHEDRRASLSVSAGDDGTVLLHCHTGCSAADIVGAVGLELSDLFPRTDRSKPSTNGKPTSKPKRSFSTAEEAVNSLGKHSATWDYHNAKGEHVGVVVRTDLPDGTKKILPVSCNGSGWFIGGLPSPRPLYGLPEILAADGGKTVYIVEGEKAADAARSIGLLVPQVTSITGWGPKFA